MFDWLGLGATVLGGLLGDSDSGGGTTSTSTNSSDPRFNKYLYDAGGVLPSASNWYQNNSTGLNEQSLAGLNRQYAVASDPNTAQGYTNMQSLGSSLMGRAVAGNPFTDGRMGGNLGQNLGQTQQPTMGGMSFNNPAAGGTGFNGGVAGAFTQPTYQKTQNAAPPTYQTQNAAQPTLQDLINKIRGGAGINFGGGRGGDNMGSGATGVGRLGSLGGLSGGFSPSYYGYSPAQVSKATGLLGTALGIPGLGFLGGFLGSSLDDADPTNPSGANAVNGMDSMSDSFGGGIGGFGGGLGGGFSGYGGGGYGGYGAGDPDGF